VQVDGSGPGSNPAVRLDGGALVPLSGAVAAAAARAPHPQVILGIRAESAAIVPESEPSALSTTVYAAEPLGDRYIYDLQLPGGAVIKVKTTPECVLDPGQPAWVRFDPAEIHLFDAAGQRRIEASLHG
jgi:ABC-type sugar transport system ATPase subunit